jgi:benzoate membrane transport protein
MSDVAVKREKARLFEKGPGFMSGLRDLPKHLNAKTITAGVVAAIFGCTGPALLVIKAATDGGFTAPQAISWIFSIYFFGGLISIVLALYYKLPISGAWSIPGAVMLISALKSVSYSDAAGGFFIAGLIVLVLGLTGLIGKVMKLIPLPIVMGMIGGAMIRFGTGIVTSVQSAPLVGAIVLFGFLILPRLSKKIPPVLSALVLGVVAALIQGSISWKGVNFNFIGPAFVMPTFGMDALFSIGIPLAVLVMGAENAQAMGVLLGQGYKVPFNAMTIVSGIGGIVTSFFGGHNANIAGPMTAICSSDEAGEAKESRYAASVVNGILFGAFGLFASFALAFVKGLPGNLVNLIAGLAMINVLYNAFNDGFSTRKFKFGSFFALVIAMSGITILKIGAPFWALVAGTLISLIVEPKDFKS